PHLELGLLTRLAERRRLERLVGLLEMPARLQQPAQLRVLDQATTFVLSVDDEGGRGEVRRRLVPREWVRELVDEAEHRAAVRLLARAAGDVQAKHQPYVVYSYWRASSTLRRDARRAGKIAAMMPTMTVARAKTISEKIGSEN